MSLTVYQMPHSPYCIPITRALEALDVEHEVLNVTPHTREEVIRRSEGKFYFVPMLDHDGKLVTESSGESIDIARYVDETFASGRLFPAEVEAAHLALVGMIENDLELAGFVLTDPFYLDSIEDLVALGRAQEGSGIERGHEEASGYGREGEVGRQGFRHR